MNRLAVTVWATKTGRLWCNSLIVVYDDIDVTDMKQVIWAWTTRTHPLRRIWQVPNTLASTLIPWATPEERAKIGHHAHVVQGVEVYRDKAICYGLGNFVFDHVHPTFGRETLVVSANIRPDGVGELSLRPMLINPQGAPERAIGSEAQDVARLLRSLSLPFGTEFKVRADDLVVLGLG